MLFSWFRRLEQWLWPTPKTPAIADVVDGLIVFDHRVICGGPDGPQECVVMRAVDSEVHRPVANLVERTRGIWFCTGRYQWTERGASYLGESGEWDLFIIWAPSVELVAVGPLHKDNPRTDSFIEKLSNINEESAQPVRNALAMAKQLGHLPDDEVAE